MKKPTIYLAKFGDVYTVVANVGTDAVTVSFGKEEVADQACGLIRNVIDTLFKNPPYGDATQVEVGISDETVIVLFFEDYDSVREYVLTEEFDNGTQARLMVNFITELLAIMNEDNCEG